MVGLSPPTRVAIVVTAESGRAPEATKAFPLEITALIFVEIRLPFMPIDEDICVTIEVERMAASGAFMILCRRGLRLSY